MIIPIYEKCMSKWSFRIFALSQGEEMEYVLSGSDRTKNYIYLICREIYIGLQAKERYSNTNYI
jgi:hypothetical protein